MTEGHGILVSTPRLECRALEASDAARLSEIAGVPEVARMLFAVTVPWPVAEAERWIETFRWRDRPGFRLGICLKDSTLIGTVYLGAAPGSDVMTCAWFIDPAHWGQGYATEAVGAVLAWGMDRFDISTVWADHFTDNPASGAVMRKLGFVEIKHGTGTSAARLEPAPVIIYRLDKANLKATP